MKYAMIALLMLAVLASGQSWQGPAPRGNNENRSLYVSDDLHYDVYQEDVGIGGYRETALGADTVLVMFDLTSATYDHAEVYIEFTADASIGDHTLFNERDVDIYWLKSMAYSARTVTAGNKLSLDNMNSGGSVVEYAYRTATVDSTSYANKTLLDTICGRDGASTGLLGPFWINATLPADSTGAGFVMITADTVGVSWRAIIIPRT